MLPTRILTILILFSLGMLHVLIFGFLEYLSNFYITSVSYPIKLSLTCFLYITAVLASCLNYLFAKRFGLKKLLIWGLYSYLFGMIFFYIASFLSKHMMMASIVLHISTILFAIAFALVVVSLTTYIVLEFPKHIGVGITILFAFMNIGAMLSPIFLNIFSGGHYGWALTLLVCLLILIGIWFVKSIFFDPKVPKSIERYRKGTLI